MQGAQADEVLDIDLALPLFQPQPAPEPKQPNQALRGILGPHLGGMADMLPMPNFAGQPAHKSRVHRNQSENHRFAALERVARMQKY